MDKVTKNVLKKELKYYQDNKKDLLKTYKRQYILIKGNELVGAYTTEEEAYKAGVENFGAEPFLIKQVVEEEVINDIPALTVGALNVRL